MRRRTASHVFSPPDIAWQIPGVIPGPEVPLFPFAVLVAELAHRILLPLENIAQTIPFRYYRNIMAHKPTREEAWAILTEHVKNPGLVSHALAVEAVMRHFARKNSADEDLRGAIGNELTG
jgi:hypothetical protein